MTEAAIIPDGSRVYVRWDGVGDATGVITQSKRLGKGRAYCVKIDATEGETPMSCRFTQDEVTADAS